jgi:hypothetical protein
MLCWNDTFSYGRYLASFCLTYSNLNLIRLKWKFLIEVLLQLV